MSMDNEWKTGLPPDNRAVWCVARNEYGRTYQFCGRYIRQWEEEATWDADDWAEYNEEKDEYYTPEGWYENQYNWSGDYSAIHVNEGEVVGWRYLPKAPEVVE